MENTVKFWGVRGSTPSPGPATARVGGNTSCVEVRLGGERIIIDGGTGLRALGSTMSGGPVVATIMFSHLHWDHIQGIPFFAPLYRPGSRLTMIGPVGLREALAQQMSCPSFPVSMDAFASSIRFVEIEAGESFTIGDVQVETAPLDHPGGAIGYRLSFGGSVVTHLCDHEAGRGTESAVLELARGADVLIHDAQYTPEEYPSKVGWGHSTYEQAARLATRSGARALLLTHHEPSRSDVELDEIERRARSCFAATTVAREGDVIVCGGCSVGEAA